jgi:hypothetical protein
MLTVWFHTFSCVPWSHAFFCALLLMLANHLMTRPEKPEEQLRVKQLTSFCGLLLEEHEEAVVEALMTDQFSKGVTPVLCQQITGRCKGKDYSSSSSSSSKAGQEEL